MTKKCFKCQKEKPIEEFYKHPRMADGHLGKCKICTREDCRPSNGNIEKKCLECGVSFRTNVTETSRGGGLTCSRECYFERFRKIVKVEDQSPNWKGDKVGIDALHQWVIKHLGRPMQCAKCGRTDCKKYEWANISRKYKRDLKDWIRLCKRCHIIFDGSKSRKNYPRLTIRQFLKLKI